MKKLVVAILILFLLCSCGGGGGGSENNTPPANRVGKPVFSVQGGTYTSMQNVAISTPTPGATIYYYFEGSAATPEWQEYDLPLPIYSNSKIYAVATRLGLNDSEISDATYIINVPPPPTPDIVVGAQNLLNSYAVDTFTSGEAGNLLANPPKQPKPPDLSYTVDSSTLLVSNNSDANPAYGPKGITIELLYLDYSYEDGNGTIWPGGTFAGPWRMDLQGLYVLPGQGLDLQITLIPGRMKTDKGGLIDRLFFGYTNQTLGGSATEGLWFFTSSITSTFFSETEREAAKSWVAHLTLTYRVVETDAVLTENFDARILNVNAVRVLL